MRYTEIILFEADSLDDALLQEAFMANLVKLAGDKIGQQVSNVTNAATAAQVLYKVMSKPEYTDTATFLLKKAIKTRLKNLDDGPLKQAMLNKYPAGRTGKDFLKGLVMICVLNAVAVAKSAVTAQALDTVTDSILNIDNIVTQVLGASAGGVGTVFQTLGIANTILFQVLTDINSKINAVRPVGI
jgi:hypothetical protein